VKLSEKVVAKLAPARGCDLVAFDAALPGFGVRVKPSGHKAYVIQYRTQAGTSRRLTLGSATVLSLEQARKRARKLLVEVSEGFDPAQDRADSRRAGSIAELAERYFAEHVRVHNKPSTARAVQRIIATRIKPALGRIGVGELSRARLKQWHQSMAATPYEANRALGYCSKMLSLAATDWELRPDNPARGIKRFPEAKRTRFLSEAELEALGKALADAAHARLERPAIILAIRLLALTGCRRSEILGLSWDRLDLVKGVLWLADAKGGARAVALGTAAVALLASQGRSDSDEPATLVCTNAAGKPLPASSVEAAWQRLCKRAGIADARLHDLRHTVGTYASGAGFNAFLIRDLLGHKTLAMTGRYVERNVDPLRAAAEATSSRIAAAMAGTHADVVPLGTTRKQR
jgi:integrase